MKNFRLNFLLLQIFFLPILSVFLIFYGLVSLTIFWIYLEENRMIKEDPRRRLVTAATGVQTPSSAPPIFSKIP
ncbi:hypothetical protein AKJ39_01405 [candidate division MSBL1 archaeon SCGC-AAA259J03]|uniref:Uncharacterized protein n=1 Tax=candidate division MSBL1 archaeon SCGC-AAA259J03 TaxID=1698269 RepID=A0A656YWR0_9EURY|nr:hypothetical protein AKJ39_01405 [candidate division MSBL1 archaeon SCGC-AAA259J03]